MQTNGNVFLIVIFITSTVTNLGSSQIPDNKTCYSGKPRFKARKQKVVELAVNSFNSNINSIVNLMQNKLAKENTETSLDDSDKLFGLLISSELNNYDDCIAAIKYKKIMKYLSEVD